MPGVEDDTRTVEERMADARIVTLERMKWEHEQAIAVIDRRLEVVPGPEGLPATAMTRTADLSTKRRSNTGKQVRRPKKAKTEEPVSGLKPTKKDLKQMLLAVARLAAEEPQFFNPMEVWQAQRVRDYVLRNQKEFQ